MDFELDSLAALGLFVAAAAGLRWADRRTQAAFLASFDGDPDHHVVHRGPPTIGSNRRPGLQVVADDIADSSCWRVTASDVRLGMYTTLSVTTVGLLGRGFGLSQILTGDGLFDQKFIVRGSDHDQLQKVLDEEEVREAITTLFRDHVSTFELNADGVLEIHLPREGYKAAQAKEALHRVESVLVALDAATAAITSGKPGASSVRRR